MLFSSKLWPPFLLATKENAEAAFDIRMKPILLTAVIRGTWPLQTPASCLSSGFHVIEASEFEVGFLLCTVYSN